MDIKEKTMFKKLPGICLSMLALCFVLAGCTSVPHVDKWEIVEEGKYDVVVDRDYLDDQAETDYTFNSFAQDIGAVSYSVDQYGPNDFYVTTPGDTEVKDLPEVRHFHTGRTLGLIIPPTVVGIFFILLFLI
jgi:hypothetical protein